MTKLQFLKGPTTDDKQFTYKEDVGGAVASWLVHFIPERAVRVRALAGDIVLCSWEDTLQFLWEDTPHWVECSTLTLSLSTQVYKWVLANIMLGVTLRWTSIPPRGK